MTPARLREIFDPQLRAEGYAKWKSEIGPEARWPTRKDAYATNFTVLDSSKAEWAIWREMARQIGCEHCKSTENVSTFVWSLPGCNYDWQGEGRDPNGPEFLCPSCKEDTDQYWREMWNDYYAVQGGF